MQINREILERMDEEFNSSEEKLKMFSALNLTLPDKISGSRAHMFATHIEQAIVIENPDSPKVFTGIEKVYGKYTDSYKKSKSLYTVVEVIPKFSIADFNTLAYTYVLYDNIRHMYDLVVVEHYENLSESHGYMRQPRPIKYKGMQILPNEVFYQSNNHDEHMNYRLGKNAKCCYISVSETEEDGFVVSESFAQKCTFWDIEKYDILLNKNDILLNIYGDNKEYKCFPDIGETVINSRLAARRKFSYKKLNDLTASSLMKVQNSDEIFYTEPEAQIIDINIHVNDKEALMENSWRVQLQKYFVMLNSYYSNLKRVLDPIVNDTKVKSTLILRSQYNRALDYLNDNIVFSNNKSGNFELAYVELTTAKKKHLVKGSKLTDRYGGKGVVVDIQPDKNMPTDSSGNVSELLLSPPGVVGRANIGQTYEHELNFCSDQIVQKIKRKKKLDDKCKLLIDYVSAVSPVEGQEMAKFYHRLNIKNKLEFIQSVETHGIYLHQAPGESIQYEQMANIYKKFKIRPHSVTSRRKLITGETKDMQSTRPVIVADKYIFLLKHTPESKFCARSLGCVNTIGLPAKSGRSEQKGGRYSSTPVRFSKMENFNACIRVDPKIVARFMSSYGTNPEFRERLSHMLLTKDPLKYHDVDYPFNELDNITAKQFHSYMNACGIVIINAPQSKM